MKVLYFHQYFSTPSGSIGTRSYEMAKRLVSIGHQVTMVCGSGAMAHTGLDGEPQNGIRRGVVEGIDVIEICLPYSNYDSLSKRALTFIKFAIKSIRIALKEDYDVLFATSTPLTAAIPGIMMRLFKPNKKFVFEVRDLWPELPKAMGVVKNPAMLCGLWVLEQLAYASMHAGVALSPGIRQGMLKGTGSKKAVIMIPNGCDLELFAPNNADAKIIGNPFPRIPQDGLCCIFTGAHGMANGLDAILDAAAVLKEKKRADIHLVLIGDGKLKPRLKQRAVSEGLDNCIFLDPIPKRKLAELLQLVDVGMMILANVPAFYYGTSPNKFFDYISTGLPVLNNYPGWISDMIMEYRCGISVSPDNSTEFANALEELAENLTATKQMGRNARQLAEKHFARNRLATEFVDWLEKVTNCPDSGMIQYETNNNLRESAHSVYVKRPYGS